MVLNKPKNVIRNVNIVRAYLKCTINLSLCLVLKLLKNVTFESFRHYCHCARQATGVCLFTVKTKRTSTVAITSCTVARVAPAGMRLWASGTRASRDGMVTFASTQRRRTSQWPSKWRRRARSQLHGHATCVGGDFFQRGFYVIIN